MGFGTDRTLCRSSELVSINLANNVQLFLQLPIKCGELTNQMRLNLEQNKECLIALSRFKFSLVINGFTDILKSIDSTVVSIFEKFFLIAGLF